MKIFKQVLLAMFILFLVGGGLAGLTVTSFAFSFDDSNQFGDLFERQEQLRARFDNFFESEETDTATDDVNQDESGTETDSSNTDQSQTDVQSGSDAFSDARSRFAQLRAEIFGEVTGETSQPEVSDNRRPVVSSAPVDSQGLTAGDYAVAAVIITAPHDHPVSLYKLTFGFTKDFSTQSGVTLGSPVVYTRTADGVRTKLPHSSMQFRSANQSGSVAFVLKDEYVIAAGESMTIEMVMTFDGMISGGSFTSRLLGGDDTVRIGDAETVAERSAFVWSDHSSTNHSLESRDWKSGASVDGLSTDWSTVTF